MGYVANNWLFYFKGGAAWAHRNGDSTTTNTVTGATLVTSTASGTPFGWTIGGGIEWQFAPHWSAAIEYDYLKFETTAHPLITFAVPTAAPIAAGVTTERDIDAHLNIVKVGVNYRF